MKPSIGYKSNECIESENVKKKRFLKLLYEMDYETKLNELGDFKSSDKENFPDNICVSEDKLNYLTEDELLNYVKLKQKLMSVKDINYEILKLDDDWGKIFLNFILLVIMFLLGVLGFYLVTENIPLEEIQVATLSLLFSITVVFYLVLNQEKLIDKPGLQMHIYLSLYIKKMYGEKNNSSVATRKNLGKYFNVVENIYSFAKKNQIGDVSIEKEIKALENSLIEYYESNNSITINSNSCKNKLVMFFENFKVQRNINVAARNCAEILMKLELSHLFKQSKKNN